MGNKLRAGALVAALFLVAGLLVYFLVGREAGPPRAVIVDQLSLTAPNPAFAEEATELLERAGYVVEYYPGEEVTVEFYRQLPSQGYDLILLRAHAGPYIRYGVETDEASLFTGESYSNRRYAEEQKDGRLKMAQVVRELYFGIMPDFVKSSMQGDFDGAEVILMGCDVLKADVLAQAFVEKGAGAVVGWDGPVLASHTDAATLSLLQRFLFDDIPVQEAAAAAMAELGPDPSYNSKFLSYPPEG